MYLPAHTLACIYVGQVRYRATYPSAVGRNVDEILRVLDALQLTDGWTKPLGEGKDSKDVRTLMFGCALQTLCVVFLLC